MGKNQDLPLLLRYITYTGDGEAYPDGQEIKTGMTIRYLVVFTTSNWGAGGSVYLYTKLIHPLMPNDWCFYRHPAGDHENVQNSVAIGEDETSFFVGDLGLDTHPNKNGQEYLAMVWGRPV